MPPTTDEPHPRPVSVTSLEDLEASPQWRRLHCSHYMGCLDHAAASGWSSFTCSTCSVKDRQSAESEIADFEGLAKLLKAMDLPTIVEKPQFSIVKGTLVRVEHAGEEIFVSAGKIHRKSKFRRRRTH